MRFDVADLRLFLAISEMGSISKGAEKVNLSLTSASERLGRMESDAGVALFVRKPRGVVMTEAGEAVLHHARIIVGQHQLLRQELADFARGAVGTLTLYANASAMHHYLPYQLSSWLNERPNLHIELKERSSDEIVQAVRLGLVQAGIIASHTFVGDVPCFPLSNDDLYVIVPKQHTLAKRKSIEFKEIMTTPFIALQHNALQSYLDNQARAFGGLTIKIALKSFDSVCQMVAQGVGVSVLPYAMMVHFGEHYEFCPIKLKDDWANRQLYVCYQDWDTLSVPMKSLLTFLQSQSN